MAELRVIAIAGAMLVAGAARADAPAASVSVPVSVPASWRELPKVAAALADGAKADGISVETSQAWGAPGRGCFAVALAVRGAGASTADQLVASLAGSGSATAVHDVAQTATHVTLGFERAPFRGRLRATLDGEAVHALACFDDGREPAACAAACAQVVTP